MKKKDSWKQDSPEEQIAALVQSVQGDLSNLAEGIPSKDPEARFLRMQQALREVQEIVCSLPKRNW